MLVAKSKSDLFIEMTKYNFVWGRKKVAWWCMLGLSCILYFLNSLFSLTFHFFFPSFSLLSLSTHYSNSLGHCVLHTIVDISLHCLMIDVVFLPHSCCHSFLVHGYCSFYTHDKVWVIFPCFPPIILFAIGIQPTATTYHSGCVQMGSLPLSSVY